MSGCLMLVRSGYNPIVVVFHIRRKRKAWIKSLIKLFHVFRDRNESEMSLRVFSYPAICQCACTA